MKPLIIRERTRVARFLQDAIDIAAAPAGSHSTFDFRDALERVGEALLAHAIKDGWRARQKRRKR